MSSQDYKVPSVLRYLWERRNTLVAESKKLQWVLDKRGETEFANDMTLQGMLGEISEFDRAIDLLTKADKFSIAKYYTIGLVGFAQEVYGQQITNRMLQTTYDASINDINSGSIQKSAEEFDKLIKGK